MKNYAVWMSRPVFVTSTFRDMQGERDWLHAHVVPALAERLRERYHHLELVDLRWGVDTAGEGGEQAKELLVLKVCVDEIRRSRPFLIGLIGDRYGWTPPPERMRAAAGEAGYGGPVEGRSITALEVEFAALGDPGQKRRNRFYLREPLPYDEMGALAGDYSDLHSGEPGAAEAHQRLEDLKRWLAGEYPGRVRRYRAGWDKDRGVVAGLEAWGRMVIEDLWADLEEETREFVHAAPATWQQEEAWVLEQFAATQCPEFIGREGPVGEALEFAAAPGAMPCYLAVTGEPGSGKSSWFGRVWQLLRQRSECLVLAQAFGSSARAGSVDAMLRRWIGELAAHLGVPDPADTLRGREEVEKAFAELLSRAAGRGRVVCLIDALNQSERTPVARQMAWLPEMWPANARLIATAVPGEESDALATRPGARRLELALLDEREQAAIAATVCGRHRKSLTETALRELLSKKLPDGRPAAGNPLWLALALEELLLLGADDFARAERQFAGTAGERLAAMLAGVAHDFPPDVPSLYDTLLARAERGYGAGWTRGFVELVAAGRTGWRESDLQALLPRVTGEAWDPLRFASLRRGFRTHLLQRGASAQWDFSHAQMRLAVQRRYADGDEARRARHELLAAHLAALPAADPLRLSERMFHLIGAGELAAVAAHYGDPALSGGEVSGATLALAAHMAAQGDKGVEWVASLVGALKGYSHLGFLCHRFLIPLQDAVADFAAMTVRLRLADAVQQPLEELRGRAPESPVVLHSLVTGYSRLGDLHSQMGQPRRALEFYQRVLAIAEEARRLPGHADDYAGDLGVCYERMGVMHMELGEPQPALESYQKNLAHAEESVRREPDNSDCLHNLGVSYYRVGQLHSRLGDLRRALEFFQKYLSIAGELRQRVPERNDYILDVGVSSELLGDTHVALGESQRALEFYRNALAIAEDLHRRVPESAEYARNVSVSCAKLGGMYVSWGKPREAGEFYRNALAIAEELYRRVPDHAEYANNLSVARGRMGELCLSLGEPQRALEFYRQALAIDEELYRRAPESADYATSLSVCFSRIGDTHRALGEPQRALEFYLKSLALRRELRQRVPENADFAHNLGLTCERLGVLHIELGEPQRGLEFLEESLRLREDLRQRAPESVAYAGDLLTIYNNLGNLHDQMGKAQSALEFNQKALAIAEELHRREPESADYSRQLAITCYNLLLHAQKTNPLLAAVCASRFLEVIGRMRNAGMFPVEALQGKYEEVEAYLKAMQSYLGHAAPQAAAPASGREPAETSGGSPFTFLKSLFAGRKSPAEAAAGQEPAGRSAAAPAPAPIPPIPAAPPRPVRSRGHAVPAADLAASLRAAVLADDVGRVAALLDEYPDLLSAKGEDGATLLHVAAFHGRKAITELLLARHAEIDARSAGGSAALHLAAQEGGKDVAELLLSRGADIHARTDGGATPLHMAAFHGQRDVAEALLASGAAVNAKNNIGATALHFAAVKGHKPLVELLLAHKAEVSPRDNEGATPLHLAVQEGCEDAAELLLAHKAEIDARSGDGWTPLHQAVNEGRKDLAELLLAHKAAVDARTSDGSTSLHKAADQSRKDLAKVLLDGKADVNARDNAGMTPLHVAAGRGHKDVVALLLAGRADVNAVSGNGRTPLHYAAFWGRDEAAEALLANRAEVNARDAQGGAPLHVAAFKGHRNMVELLLAAKASVNATDGNRATPLAYAEYKDHKDVAELLRRRGGSK